MCTKSRHLMCTRLITSMSTATAPFTRTTTTTTITDTRTMALTDTYMAMITSIMMETLNTCVAQANASVKGIHLGYVKIKFARTSLNLQLGFPLPSAQTVGKMGVVHNSKTCRTGGRRTVQDAHFAHLLVVFVTVLNRNLVPSSPRRLPPLLPAPQPHQ